MLIPRTCRTLSREDGTMLCSTETIDVMDVSSEIQGTLGRSYNVPDDIDEEELMGGYGSYLVVGYS